MQFRARNLPLLILASLIALATIGGCSQLDLSKALSLPGSKPKPKIPERMVDVWTETVLNQSGQRGVRGFGGRVMFYAKGSEDPVVVDGTFTVYAFDDTGRDPQSDTRSPDAETMDHQSPDKKYVFTREQLPKHYSESELGHSYSFWIPWDEVGGEEKQITLIARYVDALGPVVMSKPCRQTLPGIQPRATDTKLGTERAAGSKLDSEVRPASYHESKDPAAAEASEKDRRGTTTTIDVPPSFARRLTAAAGVPTEKLLQQSTIDGTASDLSEKSGQTSTPHKADADATSAETDPPTDEQPSPATAGSTADRSALSRFPVRRDRQTRPVPARVRTQPHSATWPSALPRTPRSATATE